MTEQHRAQVSRWVAWHAAELAALGVPVGLAITVSPWFWAVALVAGAGWAVHELRQHRRVQSLHAARTHQHLANTTTSTDDADPQPPGPARENA